MNEPRVGRWLIYGIIDPEGSALIYVGKTHKRRELRLREHVEAALEGSSIPIHVRIRAMIDAGRYPEIFVLKRVEPDGSWREQERQAIAFWRTVQPDMLPVAVPPQTAKSHTVTIRAVEMFNVRDGG
jgi:hypothetical protein